MKAIIVYEGKTLEYLPKLYANEFGQDIFFYIVDEMGNAINLTSCSVKLTFEAIAKNTANLINDGVCTVTSIPDGICKYTIKSTDLVVTQNSIYSAYLTLTKSTTNKEIIRLGLAQIYYN